MPGRRDPLQEPTAPPPARSRFGAGTTLLAAAAGLVLGALLPDCAVKLQYPECKNDEACAAHGQICANGFCRQCRDDHQCQAGEQCVLGGCAPRPECTIDTNCAQGLVCKAGKCAAECSEQTGAADCGAGRKCMGGRCAADEECSSDADCSGGKACVESRCRGQDGITSIASSQPLSCSAGPIFFEYDSAGLDTRARDALAEAWACLLREGYKRLLITGHTDERGTTEYNLALGGRRAETVRKYLIGLGAPGRKLRTVSFGEERPVDPASTESAWAKNRRVEIILEK